MLQLSDDRWGQLSGGYRRAFDARPALARLSAGDADAAWSELWQELHHQGDVGEASFACVPHLVQIHSRRGVADSNTHAIVSVIELCRGVGDNPDVPPWLADSYRAAWSSLVPLALSDLARSHDPSLVRPALAVVAIGRGDRRLGAMLTLLDDSEIDEVLRAHGLDRT